MKKGNTHGSQCLNFCRQKKSLSTVTCNPGAKIRNNNGIALAIGHCPANNSSILSKDNLFMFRLGKTTCKLIATFAVVAAWVFAPGQVRAGCADHGYMVHRANGEVVVVTPSSPLCPCKGPSCHQHPLPASPLTPAAPPAPAQEAWLQQTAIAAFSMQPVFFQPALASPALSGHPRAILHPPRA